MLPYVLIALGAIVVLFVAFVATRPAEFRIERSATMAASPADVFDQVNDFHICDAWSPWAKLDPAMKQSYSGPSAGVGAGYSWDANRAVGAGRMTITESRPNDYIQIQLEFLRPFKATNVAEFAFARTGNQTAVTWNMTGRKNFISKLFCLFFSMDKMIGPDFEKGLASMKSVVETAT